MEEVWKQADFLGMKNPDGSCKYEVSDLGNVRRTAYCGYRGRSYGPKLLKPVLCNGYLSMNLSDNGEVVKVYLHRLVALAFIPRVPGLDTVFHLDGDRSNNKASNLSWRADDIVVSTGRNIVKAVRQYSLDGEFIAEYVSSRAASLAVNIDKTAIAACCRRKSKLSGGYIWRYAVDDDLQKR